MLNEVLLVLASLKRWCFEWEVLGLGEVEWDECSKNRGGNKQEEGVSDDECCG
jgi:hypothetical protein